MFIKSLEQLIKEPNNIYSVLNFQYISANLTPNEPLSVSEMSKLRFQIFSVETCSEKKKKYLCSVRGSQLHHSVSTAKV